MPVFFYRARYLAAPVTLVLALVALVACGDQPLTPTSAPTLTPRLTTATAIATATLPPATTLAPTVAPTATSVPTTAPATAAAVTPTVAVNEVSIVSIKDFHSANLNNDRRVDIFLPPGYSAATDRYKVLYMNDGADTYTYNLNKLLDKLYAANQLEKIIVVAIFNTPSRLSEYGVAGIPDSKSRGDRADLYSKFVLEELMPYVKKNYRIEEGPANTAFMGSSLGGLMAFDLVWRHPDLFGKVGVFSGSFWWRTDDSSPAAQQNSRIMHKIVRESQKREGLKMWFSAGTKEETSDRDNNGVIDVIQDTTELIDLLKAKGYRMGTDIVYTQIEGGTHDQITWAKVLPDFLKWAFPG